MQKLKSIKLSGIMPILKASLIAIVTTLLGIVIFAIVLKFADIPSGVVNYINDIIKALSVFVMVLFIKKMSGEKLLVKSLIGGLVYALLAFIIFSILNGGFNFNMSFIYDLLFTLIVSLVASVIFNIMGRKNS